MLWLFQHHHPVQLLEEGQQERQGNNKGERIRNGLADLYAYKAESAGQNEDERNEEHALTQQARKVARPALPTLWKVMFATTMTGCSRMARH